MQIWWFFAEALNLINNFSIYFSILLGRCAILSFLILFLVTMLRQTILKRFTFLRGLIWAIFFIVPFMGKLNLYYDNKQICDLFMWWNDACMSYWPIRYGYLISMFICAGVIIYRRRKIQGLLQTMKNDYIFGQKILTSEMMTTPFVTGLFYTKIVIPKVILYNFETEELKMVLLHENTHIRLGHLWCYFLWDVLRILLWPNFFLTTCMKDFREDMEDICDKVTIQWSGKDAYEYGKMLIKSIKVLQKTTFETMATFVGEKNYIDMKQRVMKIAGYRPYNKWWICSLCVCSLSVLVGIFFCIKENSLPRYKELYDMVLIDDMGKTTILENSRILRKAISVDEEKVFIDRSTMNLVLKDYKIEATNFSILFGGYEKLPGFGGRGNLIDVDYDGKEETLEIPYENSDKYISTIIFKMM